MKTLNQKGERTVEILTAAAGENGKLITQCNHILLITKGVFSYIYKEESFDKASEGEMMFLLPGKSFSYTVEEDIRALVIKIIDPVKFCGSLPEEELFAAQEIEESSEEDRMVHAKLPMNQHLKDYAESLETGIDAGLRFKGYFDIKTRELFILLRMYYDKEEVRSFFLPLFGYEASFMRYVTLNWMKYRTVAEFAESKHMTPKQFNKHFVAVMGKSPSRWMIESRAEQIKKEIITTDKNFTHIAIDHEFCSDSEFFRFCKREFGMTPGEIRKQFGGTSQNASEKDENATQQEN